MIRSRILHTSLSKQTQLVLACDATDEPQHHACAVLENSLISKIYWPKRARGGSDIQMAEKSEPAGPLVRANQLDDVG